MVMQDLGKLRPSLKIQKPDPRPRPMSDSCPKEWQTPCPKMGAGSGDACLGPGTFPRSKVSLQGASRSAPSSSQPLTLPSMRTSQS